MKPRTRSKTAELWRPVASLDNTARIEMPQKMKFQDPGEGIHEGEIVEVLVSEGDSVSEGDEVLVVETDKATTSLPASRSGTIAEVKVNEGDQVEVGDVLLVFGEDATKAGDEDESEGRDKEDQQQDAEQTSEPHDQDGEADSKKKEQDGEDEPTERRGGKSFAVGELPGYKKSEKRESKSRESARAEGDEEGQAGNASREEDQQDTDADQSKKAARKSTDDRPVPASPATRRLARELDVDLRDVDPSGPHDRVTDDDVRAAAEGNKPKQDRSQAEHPAETKDDDQPSRRSTEKQPTQEQPELPDFGKFGKVERVPLRSVRRTTAKLMTLSWQRVPHVCHHDSVDITELERWRRDRSPKLTTDDQRISLMVLVMKAVSGLLKRYPRFNASLDTNQSELILKHYCHLGIAIDTERGLIVGVIRDVDRLPLAELAEETQRTIKRVRSGEVKRDELRGATFTVTNVGPLGGTSFEPLVNYPQAAILGMARAQMQQVVSGDLDDPQVNARLMLPLSLSYDHRINDGADAARFVSDLRDSLRSTDSMLMNI